MKKTQVIGFNAYNCRVWSYEDDEQVDARTKAYAEYETLYTQLKETGELDDKCPLLSFEEFLVDGNDAFLTRNVNDYIIYTKNYIDIPKNFYIDLNNGQRMCVQESQG